MKHTTTKESSLFDFDDPRRFGKSGKGMTVRTTAPSPERFPQLSSTDLDTSMARGREKWAAQRHARAASARLAAGGSNRAGGAHQTPSTYVIGIEGSTLVKIGFTGGAPRTRVAQLQTGIPMQLTLLWHCFGDYEAELHAHFAAHRVRGEWFDLTPLGDPVEVIKGAVEEINATVDA